MATSPLRVILVTAPPKKAEGLARALLKERLVACVNLIPKIRSLYWWEGKICDEPETLMVMKTPKRHVAALRRRVKDLHPYTVPEFLALAVESTDKPYADWVAEQTKRKGR